MPKFSYFTLFQKYLFSTITLLITFNSSAQALSLKQYLEQVKTQKLAYKSSEYTRDGGTNTTFEKDLLLSPNFFINTTYKYDRAQPQQPGVNYDNQKSLISTIGFKKITTFGTKIELGYELDYIGLQGVRFGGMNLGDFGLYTSKPYLALTQSIWQNGFGANTQANYEQLDAQGLQKSLNAQYQEETLMIDAESSYWDLVVARSEVEMQKQTVNQAQQILDWHTRRRRDNLNELSDLLQAKAAYQNDQLELKKAVNKERELAQAFNEMRAVQSSTVTDSLDDLPDPGSLQTKDLSKGALRSDVKAAEQAMRLANANSRMSIEKDKPQVDLNFTYGRSGQAPTMSAAQSSIVYPGTTVGVQVTVPLDFEAARKARLGHIYAEMATEATYQQQLFDEKKDRENLSLRMSEAKEYLLLAIEVEKAQEDKLSNERRAFKNGRTTTYQVLTFERDYIQARLTKIKSMADLLKLIAQAKLYENEDRKTANQPS